MLNLNSNMKKTRFKKIQIVLALKENESGAGLKTFTELNLVHEVL